MLFLRGFFLLKPGTARAIVLFDCTIKTEFFLAQILWEFALNIRECINKIRPKLHFLSKIEIKMTHLVVFFVIYCLFASRATWKPFDRRLRFPV